MGPGGMGWDGVCGRQVTAATSWNTKAAGHPEHGPGSALRAIPEYLTGLDTQIPPS